MHHEVFPHHKPYVSIIVPAYNEGKIISETLDAICKISYPHYEIVVVNDGSPDDVLEKVLPFVQSGRVRLLTNAENQGKALALNDVIGVLNGEVIVILDADAEPEPDILHHLTWHFQHARVGAVTGHPRVKNVKNLLTRIQVMEFTSIIGLLRRSQRIWGRIVTVSGIVTAFRREALYEVEGFCPNMYTEDIDITWKLERRHWDVRYEPRAVVWMQVPETLKLFFKQRLRWARGLLQVLKVNRDIPFVWQYRRLWPMYYECCLSILWTLLFGIVSLYEGGKFLYELLILEQSPSFRLQWLVLMATFSLFQLLLGGLLEIKHDKDVVRFFPYMILYPSFYWVFMIIVTLTALPALVRSTAGKVKWLSIRGH